MLKTISKALFVLTLAGLMLWSPLSSAQAANNSFYYISAETDYNAKEPIYVVGHKERTLEYHHQISKVFFMLFRVQS